MNTRYIKNLKVIVRRGQESKSEKGDFLCVPPVSYRNDRENKKIAADSIMFDRVRELWNRMLTGTGRLGTQKNRN